MAVSNRQFALLSEMGINLWQQRDTISTPTSDVKQGDAVSEQQTHPIDFSDLCSEPLFQDIVRSLGASIAQASLVDNKVSLGLLKWQFSPEQQVEFNQTVLTTPDIEQLKHSPWLKSQLWQVIQSKGLSNFSSD